MFSKKVPIAAPSWWCSPDQHGLAGEADLVIQMMQGRYFGQRQLSAEAWDGKTKYK